MKFIILLMAMLFCQVNAAQAWSLSDVLKWMFGGGESTQPHKTHFDPSFKQDPEQQHWAVLIAGSAGYFNYRHQADVAHAYHLLLNNGYHEDKIIVLMKDDVAHDPRNPEPGTLINRPGGKDLYAGLKIDYKGPDVTPAMFKKVLLGEPTFAGTGRVLRSGPKDHVFVNFVDHGGVGLIAFPAGIMTSKDLTATLSSMKDKGMYEKLVFYMEACESGSMFEGLLPPTWNIFATTAATGSQSSFAYYYDTERKTFLGDLYSISWMEDSEEHFLSTNPKRETIEDQFNHVYQRVMLKSQPQQFGDVEYARNTIIEEFQADMIADKPTGEEEDGSKTKRSVSLDQSQTASAFLSRPGSYTTSSGSGSNKYHGMNEADMVSSRDVTAESLMRILKEGSNGKNMDAFGDVSALLEQEYRNKQEALDRFKELTFAVVKDHSKASKYYEDGANYSIDHDCLHEAIHNFNDQCHPIDEYHIQYTKVLAQLCADGYTPQQISAAIESAYHCQA